MRVSPGVRKDMSDETVRRDTRYPFLLSSKKGLLKKDGLKKRQKFACRVTKMLTDKFWKEGISFYIDAAGFQHRYNPFVEVWSLQSMLK